MKIMEVLLLHQLIVIKCTFVAAWVREGRVLVDSGPRNGAEIRPQSALDSGLRLRPNAGFYK